MSVFIEYRTLVTGVLIKERDDSRATPFSLARAEIAWEKKVATILCGIVW